MSADTLHGALADLSEASTLRAVCQHMTAWLKEAALPLWAGTGRDSARDVFYERLLADGRADIAAPRRSRVQARQIYVYSHAAILGLFPAGATIALAAFDTLLASARSADRPGFAHLLAADGIILDPRRDTYDHAFMVLAFSWLWRATGETRVKRALDEVLAFIDQILTLPDGSLREDDEDGLPRRQNSHMHMFEAMLALQETGARQDGIARADRLLATILRYFIDGRTGLVGEYFGADLSAAPDAAGMATEPGHMAEWSWLFHARLRLAPQPPHLPDLRLLSRLALERARHSEDARTGFLIDEADRGGRPLRRTRRLWPQTELIKACLAQVAAGDGAAADHAALMLVRLAKTYLAPAPAGAWLDQFDETGQSLVASLPASTFYHLFIAMIEAGHCSQQLARAVHIV